MRIQRNLRLIDTYTIGMNMILVLPILLPYYRDQIGIGFREFMIGEAFFAATIVALDVPTGWISDTWQRKHAQGLGILFLIMGYSCLLAAHSFAMAVIGQSVIGIGISLCNGTNTAILYDSLLSVGREAEYRKREGRRQALCLYSVAVSSIVGSMLYSVHHQLPLVIMLACLVGALIASCALDEPERHKRASRAPSAAGYPRHDKIRGAWAYRSRLRHPLSGGVVLHHEDHDVVAAALLHAAERAWKRGMVH